MPDVRPHVAHKMQQKGINVPLAQMKLNGDAATTNNIPPINIPHRKIEKEYLLHLLHNPGGGGAGGMSGFFRYVLGAN